MSQFISLKFAIFVAVLALMLFWEHIAPFKAKAFRARLERIITHLSLAGLNILVMYIALPVTAIGASLIASEHNIGLFNMDISSFMPEALIIILCIAILDFVIYAQHIAFHKIPLLWRLHSIHHSDTELDTSTGLRFHPLEALISMILKCAIIFLLGAPAISVILFEILLNGGSLFSHSNIRMPDKFEKFLRIFIVTPHMHKTHHSQIPEESMRNYGFFLSVWDRIFKTYQVKPKWGYNGVQVGLKGQEGITTKRLDHLLIKPFKK